jgi:hypothetical protein
MVVVDWRPKNKGKEDHKQQSELEERREEWRRSKDRKRTGARNPEIENRSNLWKTFLDKAGLITRLLEEHR